MCLSVFLLPLLLSFRIECAFPSVFLKARPTETILSVGGEGGLKEARLVAYLRRWDQVKDWGARLVKLEGYAAVGDALKVCED